MPSGFILVVEANKTKNLLRIISKQVSLIKSPRRDSNPRPTDYKSVALPAELQRLNRDAKVVCRKISCNTFLEIFLKK